MPQGMSQWARAVRVGASQRVRRDMGLLRSSRWALPSSLGCLEVSEPPSTLSNGRPKRRHGPPPAGIIRPMTERGLPGMDGAPACPFVAFGDDREARSTSPDHRHRCFAESPAAPRALAHQEAYCLSSAFPVCPTFQDWARREAAHELAAGDQAAAPPPPAAATPPPPPIYDLYADWSMPTPEPLPPGMEPLSDVDPSDAGPPSDQASDESEEPIQRNPPRDWAAPPPWATGAATAAALSGRPAGPGTPAHDGSPSESPPPSRQVEGQGLAGSPADRLAAGEVPAAMALSD